MRLVNWVRRCFTAYPQEIKSIESDMERQYGVHLDLDTWKDTGEVRWVK